MAGVRNKCVFTFVLTLLTRSGITKEILKGGDMIVEVAEKLIETHTKFPLFGILLFTEEHPYVVQLLKDKSFYTAIDIIAKEHIAIFATMLFTGEYKYPRPPLDAMPTILPIWKEPAENKKILSWFKIDDSRDLPVFVIFGIKGDNLYYVNYRIDGDSVESVFNSIQDILLFIDQQTREGKFIEKQELFQKVQWKVRRNQAKEKLRQILENIALFRGSIAP